MTHLQRTHLLERCSWANDWSRRITDEGRSFEHRMGLCNVLSKTASPVQLNLLNKMVLWDNFCASYREVFHS